MSSSFKIDYEWLPSSDGDAPERWTVAALVMNVGPWCATEVEDIFAKTVRSSARLSALHLAEWFAANWWRLMWEPRADTHSWRVSHRIGNAGYGYVWPDVSFSSDWQSVHISSRPTAKWEAEPIRYLNHFDCLVPVKEFEKGVDDFVNGTVARLSGVLSDQSDLSMLWNEVTQERLDPESSESRILEACMGYEPDEAPSWLLDALRQHTDSFGVNAIKEMAAAYKDEAIPHLMDLRGSASRDGIVAHVPECGDIRSRITSESDDSDIPWRRAERAAEIARDVWDLVPPISTRKFCDLLDISQDSFLEDQSSAWGPFMAGFRDSATSERFHVSLNRKYSTSRRFDLARLLADHLVTGGQDRLLPGTRSKTSRQKFQRAFAQEFLCPFDALREHVKSGAPTSDEIDDAAQYFGVSPIVIHTTLVNKGMLERESLDDWIE